MIMYVDLDLIKIEKKAVRRPNWSIRERESKQNIFISQSK